jgi:hypothetical protein
MYDEPPFALRIVRRNARRRLAPNGRSDVKRRLCGILRRSWGDNLLCKPARLWDLAGVNILGATRYLIATLVVAGLMAAPLAAPAAARAMHETAMASMPDDMPCCPHAPPLSDGQKRQCVAACVTPFAMNMPEAAIAPHASPSLQRMVFPPSDTLRESLGQAPPPRPPRSPVFSA